MRFFSTSLAALTLAVGALLLPPSSNAGIYINLDTGKTTLKNDRRHEIHITSGGNEKPLILKREQIKRSLPQKFSNYQGEKNAWVMQAIQFPNRTSSGDVRGAQGEITISNSELDSRFLNVAKDYHLRATGNPWGTVSLPEHQGETSAQEFARQRQSRPTPQPQRQQSRPTPQPQRSASRPQTEYEAMMERVNSGAPTPNRSNRSPATRSTARSTNTASSRCPAGTSYHKIKSGGLLSKKTVAEGCFSDFEASQLRMQANNNEQQRRRGILDKLDRDLKEATKGPVNCSGTVNSWGNGYATYNTNCN